MRVFYVNCTISCVFKKFDAISILWRKHARVRRLIKYNPMEELELEMPRRKKKDIQPIFLSRFCWVCLLNASRTSKQWVNLFRFQKMK